jgi:hypothetical protein
MTCDDHSTSYLDDSGMPRCALCRVKELEALLRRAMLQIGASSKLYLECEEILATGNTGGK